MKQLIKVLMLMLVLNNATAEDSLDTALKLHGKKDYKAAFEIFNLLANNGNAAAQANIGFYYDNGYGVEKNYEVAVRWYKRAAKNGNIHAQYNLGVMYEIGVGVSKDYEKAYEWFNMAAESGDRQAAAYLGLFHEEGLGRPVDNIQAYAWYSIAAEWHEKYGADKRDTVAKILDKDELKQARVLTDKLMRELGDTKINGGALR